MWNLVMRRRARWARRVGTTVSCALLLSLPAQLGAQALATTMPHVQGTRKLVLEVIEGIVNANPGVQLVGQGSWLRPPDPKKAGYADPLMGGSSDQDVRFFVEGEAKTAAQQELLRTRWLDMRKKFVDDIEKKFLRNANDLEPFLLKYGFKPEEAATLSKKPVQELIAMVKKSINFYPPNQIVTTIVDDKMAPAVFKKLGAVPNLGDLAPEGVWGPGKTVTVQELESFSRARVFYVGTSGSGVRSAKAGFADLVHLAEGHGFYTREGAANMSYQWLEKATEAFEHGDVRLVAKYLDRVSAWLEIAKNKGGLPAGYPLNTFQQLDFYTRRALAGDAAVAGDPQLKALLKELQFQTEILYKMSRTAGEGERAVLQAVLTQQPSTWSRVSAQMRGVAAKTPSWVNTSLFIDGSILAISAYLVPRTAASESVEAAYRQAGVDLAFMAGLPAGFAAMFTNMILDDAKAFGYGLIIQQQDWENFLNGISLVKGFEGTTDLKGMERNIDDLALKMTTREQVTSFVRLQAYNIAALNTEADVEKRTKVAEGLEQKFTPVVIGKWQKRRNELMADALEVLPDIELASRRLSVRLDLSAQDVKLTDGKGTVTVSPLVDKVRLDTLQRFVSKYRDAAMKLGGAKRDKVFLTETYRMRYTYDGKVISDRSASRASDVLQPLTIEIAGLGRHDVTAQLDVGVSVSAVGMDPRDVAVAQPLFARTFTQSVSADVAGVVDPPPSGIGQSNEFEMEVMIPGLGMTNPNIVSRKNVVLAIDDFHWDGRKFVIEARWRSKPFCLIGTCSPSWDSTRVHVEGEIDSTGSMLKRAKSTMYRASIGWSDSTKKTVTTREMAQNEMEVKDVPLARVKQDLVWEGYVWGPRFPGHLLRYTDHRQRQENIKGGQNFDNTQDYLPMINELRVRFRVDPKIRSGALAPPPAPAASAPAASPPAPAAPAGAASGATAAPPSGGGSAPTPSSVPAPTSPAPSPPAPTNRADSAAQAAKASLDSAAKAVSDKVKATKESIDEAKKAANDLFKGLFKKKKP